ncbi:hypothetical protein G6M89_01635 [Natronolimnobius sp. AArcel1]|uniref:hypothetical protein n=1 Tax=Natronolimnobius sp. AArcel1 TaxID=1679093 RepID=UPI0013EA8BCE|nr:hypothetical protein [Natronolimnobius sp. AArcel1]NGM67722.1 hypothetical protein [Natronolimnobius sp. AArcel1]
MKLRDLIDTQWNSYERKRFLKDRTKEKTESFDPESFKHDGFDNRERYFETYVPALAEDTRLDAELNNFTPPRLDSVNDSSYQALVIRYGILRTLIQQLDFNMEKEILLESVQSWQQDLINDYSEDDFDDSDELLHLAKAAVDYGSDVYDSELHMVYSYFELHNRAKEKKHEYYTWFDFFKRLSAIGRFPKVSRSEKPEHALDTIEKGLWSLQEQAIIYEVNTEDTNELVGIPEDYIDYIRDWLYYEMSEENYLQMLETLEPFDKQKTLVDARNTFGVETGTKGRNDKRRESLVKAGIFPSQLLAEGLTKKELKGIVDEYSLDAHKQKTDEMIEATIEYFEQSQKQITTDDEEAAAELFLKCYEDISDGNVERIPPQLQQVVDEDDPSRKMDMLFEQATSEIFKEIFNVDGTELLGQKASGIVADGEIEQDGKWLLWDNKRRINKFKLGSNTQSKIKNYIDTKSQQHQVEWFLIIAPDFTDNAKQNAKKLEMQVGGIDIRLVKASDLKQFAEYWIETYAEEGYELPLSVFYGSEVLEPEIAKEALKREFS